MDTVAISNFNSFLLCVQNYMDFSYSNLGACKVDKGFYRADGPKDIKGLKETSSIQLLMNLRKVGIVTTYIFNLK